MLPQVCQDHTPRFRIGFENKDLAKCGGIGCQDRFSFIAKTWTYSLRLDRKLWMGVRYTNGEEEVQENLSSGLGHCATIK